MAQILIVGSKSPLALEKIYFKHLKRLGMEVSFFDPADFYKIQNIKDKINFRYFPGVIYKVANEALLKEIEHVRPDIVWIFKGIEFLPETLQAIKKRNIYLVNYNPDHPFIRTFASSGGRNIVDSVPCYDLHFCYSLSLTETIQSQYKLKSFWLPFGYDLTSLEYEGLQSESEIHKICFIGNPDKIRAKTIKALAKLDYTIEVYGYNWNKFISPGERIRIFNQVLGLEYWRILRKYRVQINIFRPHNINSHNMRTFEIPACGGIQIAPFSRENEIFFENKKEIFLYKDEEELVDIVQDLMDRPIAEINDFREAARSRVVNDHCSYEFRAKYVAGILKDI